MRFAGRVVVVGAAVCCLIVLGFTMVSARNEGLTSGVAVRRTMNTFARVSPCATRSPPSKILSFSPRVSGSVLRKTNPVYAVPGGTVPRIVSALDLTPENVEIVLDEVRPYLQADGGSVDFVEIEGPLVKLRLKGACSSCASSSTTMQLGIKRRLQERIPTVGEVVDVGLTEEKLDVSIDNIEKILDEIRPYLVGASGGSLEYLGGIESNQIKIRITGPASKILTVRVAIQQKIKEKFPPMMRVEVVS